MLLAQRQSWQLQTKGGIQWLPKYVRTAEYEGLIYNRGEMCVEIVSVLAILNASILTFLFLLALCF